GCKVSCSSLGRGSVTSINARLAPATLLTMVAAGYRSATTVIRRDRCYLTPEPTLSVRAWLLCSRPVSPGRSVPIGSEPWAPSCRLTMGILSPALFPYYKVRNGHMIG